MNGWASIRESWRKSGRLFLSLFAVAAFLPVVLMGTLSPDGFKLISEADSPEPLRLWFEPTSAVSQPGQTFKLKLMAEYSDSNKLIPQLEFDVKGNGLATTDTHINYKKAFVGKVEVGEVEVTAGNEGEATLEIVEGSVNTTLPDLQVVVSPARITIRR